MALPMVTRWGVHDVAALPTDTHLDAPGPNHGRFRTCLTMTLPDPTRPVPIEDSSRCDRRPAKSHAPMLRAVVTFVAGWRGGVFWNSSGARSHALSRAHLESPARRYLLTPDANFLLRQCCAPLRSSRSGHVPWPLTVRDTAQSNAPHNHIHRAVSRP